MQSHQRVFPPDYQPEKLGHRRRPSIGKSMPVTSLLLNFPPPPSQMKTYGSLSRDGLSPEFEKPPYLFQLNEVNDVRSEESSDDNNTEQDYEILISESSDNEDNESEDKCSLVGNMESDIPCSMCIEENIEENSIFHQLCKKLCDDKCKNNRKEKNDDCFENCNLKIYHQNNENDLCKSEEKRDSLKIQSKIEEQRRNFLNNMLKSVDDNDNNDVDDVDDNDQSTINDRGIEGSDSLIIQNESLKLPEIFFRGCNASDYLEKYTIAEALAKTSMMTSPAAKRRLAARKIEWELDANEGNTGNMDSGDKEFIPPRELLLYLVRMGSFNSAPKINNPDSQDDSFEMPRGLSTKDLLQHCKLMRGVDYPKLLSRQFFKPFSNNTFISNGIAEGLRVLELNAVSKGVCSPPLMSPKQLRILQWNVLSQSLGQHNDGFVRCPDEALSWDNRKYLIIEEILRNNPDVICLQEVDHFKFLERVLGSQNYSGIFFPKPDSPCLYIEENNGPDGCAIFYKSDKFDLINYQTRVLEVWRVQSNQVAIAANFKIKETGKEFSVCTTHLKARNGALLSKLRNEQGKDLLKFANNIAQNRPLILCGDFNAEPIEPVYSTVLNFKELNLSSAYAEIHSEKSEKSIAEKSSTITKCSNNDEEIENCEEEQITKSLTRAEILATYEPPYTTWKIREEGEVCHTIDYIFYTKDYFKVSNCLMFPKEDEIGKNRTPSLQYPSDHFSLVCDFEILDRATDNGNK